MKTVSQLFKEQFERKVKRGWDLIYVVVDWHDTLMPATYTLKERNFNYFPYCIEALKRLSDKEDVRIILFTSSYQKDCYYLIEDLFSKGIHVDFINENPDEKNTPTGDFSRKFYYNILLDDKAGFDPLTDWKEINDLFEGL